jgi:AcrR family transcriptional regulator
MPAKPRTLPRKEATQARAQATVDAILEATARILVKVGYDHASTNRIAAEAGVSVGSLYQYYPSKEALVAALVDRHVEEMFAVLLEKSAHLFSLPIEHAVAEVVRTMVAAHAVDPKLHKVLVEQVPRIGRLERVEAIERETALMVRAYLEARQNELVVRDLELASFIVVGMIEALTHGAVLTRPELLGAAFVEEVTQAVVRYLTGVSAGSAGARMGEIASHL